MELINDSGTRARQGRKSVFCNVAETIFRAWNEYEEPSRFSFIPFVLLPNLNEYEGNKFRTQPTPIHKHTKNKKG